MLSQRRLRSLRRRINRLQCESCHVPSRVVVSLWELWGGSGRLIRWKTLESDFHKWQSHAMADFNNILIFVKVAQFESISRAARSLGMPISTVSRRLSVLESQLGVTLLRRTTRRGTLTAQGREYFNQCHEPLSLLQDAQRVPLQRQRAPEGILNISGTFI